MRSTGWYTSPLPYDTVRRLSQALGVSEVAASVLARRGYSDAGKAAAFLDSEGALHDPFLFPQMRDVCSRIHAAVSRGEKIFIHGDYDVDGVTSTALLVYVLRALGADVTPHLPNRFNEGYGIAVATVEKIAAAGARLMITVDCGISAREQIVRAGELGVETIVIDHHKPVEADLPPALIIAPLLCDYPFKELAGVGLAFKVAQALTQATPAGGLTDLDPELARHLDLVALGTIADVVPLVDENRALVKRGLVQLSRTCKPGLEALMRAGQVDPGRINAGLVAFRMAPRINAAGRLDDPGAALDLMLSEDAGEAEELASRLDGFNRERQRIENQMLADARKIIGAWPEELAGQRGYVLSSPGWHEGVIGIVASRLVEIYNRPVIMIAEDEENGHGKGSGRSISGFDLHGSLVELSGLLAAFGGHRAACGLTIETGSIEEFRRSFGEFAGARLTDAELAPSRYVDALVCGRELTLELAEELSRLEPFGLGNPSVELLVTGARISADRVTKDGQHLQCLVEAGGARAKAIGFGQAFLQEKLRSEPAWDVAVHLERNEFNGSVSPQLQLREFFAVTGQAQSETGLCGHRCDYECPDRRAGDEFWSLLDSDLGLPESWQPLAGNIAESGGPASSLDERLIDRRNFGGIPAQVAKLISGGERVLLITADVARRRRLVSHGLPTNGSPLTRVSLSSSRCGRAFIAEQLRLMREPGPALQLADFATLAEFPQLAGNFEHLVFIDPPFSRLLLQGIASAAPAAYVHLFYCSDEVQFTGKVLEHEYDLRGPLTRVYKRLETGKYYPLNETTERLLLAGGKYLRQPVLVARCLRILKELNLISIEEKAEGPIMTLLESGRADLEQSPIYRTTQSFYKECSQFLSKSLDAKVI